MSSGLWLRHKHQLALQANSPKAAEHLRRLGLRNPIAILPAGKDPA